MTLTCL